MVLRLLQSIFTAAPSKPGKFDEALIRSAIERVVDGTDPRLRAVRNYQRKLRDAVEQAIAFVVAFVDTFPPAVELSRRSFTTDPRVRALFASPQQLQEVISFSQGMLSYLDQNPGPLPETLYAVLVAERVEKNVIGMDLHGDLTRRDVAQTVVNFHDPRVSLPTDNAAESRHDAMNRVFDYLIEIALQRLVATRSRKQQLEQQQRSLLQKKAQLYKASTRALEPLMEIRVPAAPDAGALEKQLQEAYAQRKEKESLLTEAEQNYFQARGGINELDDNLRKLNKQRQDAQVLVNNLKDKANDLKFEISSVAQRLRIEFNIDINTIVNKEVETEIPQEELELKVERLRGRLENYGEINPLAVEAYDEMNERYESITRQRDDILQAKKDLEETIKEIEETATTQFLEAFEKARLYFIDVFRSLFTEDDTCDLILIDPTDPLESRIEIVAKPKGKRPQTINQLSGGEKTLTATALLFALYLLKPAPFCIFDEVDAPLDDANIEKFNRIIKKFSNDSQFIIVTHNKLTMAAVDTIYGVYMAEQGVSGVSPVDFRDFEHTASFEVVEN